MYPKRACTLALPYAEQTYLAVPVDVLQNFTITMNGIFGREHGEGFFALVHLLTKLILFLICLVTAPASTLVSGSLKGLSVLMSSSPKTDSGKRSWGSLPSVMVKLGSTLAKVQEWEMMEDLVNLEQILHCPNHYGVVMGRKHWNRRNQNKRQLVWCCWKKTWCEGVVGVVYGCARW